MAKKKETKSYLRSVPNWDSIPNGSYFKGNIITPSRKKITEGRVVYQGDEVCILNKGIGISIEELFDTYPESKVFQYASDTDNKYTHLFSIDEWDFDFWGDGSTITEIIPDKSFKVVEPKNLKVTVEGSPVKVHKGFIEVGCTTVTNDVVREIAKNLVD